ncbi:succinate dehydrogenase assembly factor 2 [Sphingorhabdus buctiana]|jgi:antitoxin CptB|uniref:FAD assembly factor SdhE n=1 Tax=Sphingorhabdus buctiana TaxID=1508805 RepID=A0ABW4MD84_9SPHN
MDRASYLRKLHFRAHHRGTREADAIVGGFFDCYHGDWSDADFAWFEALLEEQDVDIMGWAMGTIAIPDRWHGPMMEQLKRLDYIELPSGLGNAQ